MYLPKLFLRLLVSPVLAGALLTSLSFDLGMNAHAQTTGTVTPSATPTQRPRYRFHEEERRILTPTPAEEREDKAVRASNGFDTTFLTDALTGNQDPGSVMGRNPPVNDGRGPETGIVNSQSPPVPQPSLDGRFGIFQTAP